MANPIVTEQPQALSPAQAQAQDLALSMIEKIYHRAPEAAFVLSRPGMQVLYLNEQSLRLFEAEDEAQLIDKYMTGCLHVNPLSLDDLMAEIAEVEALGFVTRKYQYKTLNGRPFWGHFQVVVVGDEAWSGYVVTMRDISHEEEANERLRYNEALLEYVFHGSPDAVFLVRKSDHRVARVNQRAVRMFEAENETQLLNIEGGETLHVTPASDQIRLELQDEFLTKGEVDRLFHYKTFQGNTFWGSMHMLNIAAEDFPYYLVTVRDVSQEHASHERLVYSESLLKSVFNESPDAIFLADVSDSRILSVNHKAIEIFEGESEEDFIGKPGGFLQVTEDSPEERAAAAEEVINQGQVNREYLYRTLKGREFLGAFNAKIIHIESKPYFMVRVMDMSPIKALEQAWQTSEKLFRHLYENFADAIFLVDMDSNQIVDVNQRAVELFESGSKEALIGIHGQTLQVEPFSPEELDILLPIVLSGQRYNCEREYQTLTGNRFWGDVTFHNLMTDGLRYSIVRVSDITERKRAEEEIRRSLKEKETLIKEIHHRVKNNLAIVSGLLHLQSSNFDDPATKAAFAESQNRIRGMALIHEQLYQSQTLSDIDFGVYLDNLVRQLIRSYPGVAAITTEIKAEEAVSMDIVQAVPSGLMVNEIISNAIKHAFEPGKAGHIEVSLRQDEHYIWLVVSDNGQGMADTSLVKNSKTLGLMLVRELANQVKAELSVDSAPGQGTRFTLRFGRKG